MWSPQFHAFPERPVIALDRRGCGASTAPHDLAAEPHDVLAVLDQLGFERCVLVGMSQAGQIAAELALAEPSRLAGLVLHGARLGPLAAGQTPDIPLGEYRSLVKSGRLPAMKARWREHALMRLVDTAWQAEVDAMLARYDGSDLREDVSARPPIAHERLRRLATPTLVIVGDRDTALRRKVARELACILPQARLSEIAGAGHMCNLCSANTYNTALGDFLESL